MARTFGLDGGLWTLGLSGLVLVPPLAYLAPAAAVPAGALFGLAMLVLSQRRAAKLAAAQEKLSGEIGVVSQRLLRVETVAAATARAQLEQASIQRSQLDKAEAALDDRIGSKALDAAIDAVESEIGLLSGIVRELASVVAAQEDEIARLKVVRVAEPAPPSERLEIVTSPRPIPPILPPKIAAFVPTGFAPTPSANAATPIARDPSREAELIAAFDGEGLEVWLQPLVALPQRKVVSYEALARLRLGSEILAPEGFLNVLERHGRTTSLDRRMLQQVATIARHLQRRGSTAVVAYALSPNSLFEPGFLRSLAKLGAGEKELAGRVVVALPQSSLRNLDAEQSALLATLRGTLGFCLDRPTHLRFDTAALAEHGITQVKVPATLLLQPSREAMPDIALEDLVTALGRAGIQLVATQVDHEVEVPDLIDLDVPLAQGSVFASPKAVRAEVFAAPASAPAPKAPEPDEPEPPPQRRPFREFLRRAV